MPAFHSPQRDRCSGSPENPMSRPTPHHRQPGPTSKPIIRAQQAGSLRPRGWMVGLDRALGAKDPAQQSLRHVPPPPAMSPCAASHRNRAAAWRRGPGPQAPTNSIFRPREVARGLMIVSSKSAVDLSPVEGRCPIRHTSRRARLQQPSSLPGIQSTGLTPTQPNSGVRRRFHWRLRTW